MAGWRNSESVGPRHGRGWFGVRAAERSRSEPPPTEGVILDPDELARVKQARRVHFHRRQVPLLRLVGFLLLALIVACHNWLVFGPEDWPQAISLIAIMVSYSLVTWIALRLFYERVTSIDLGELFLLTDPLMYLLAIYYSGGERSLLFFLLITRVADQANTSFRRMTFFNHYVMAGYLGLLVYLATIEHRPISWPLEAMKMVSIYIFNWYISLTSLTAERLRRRTSAAVHKGREELIRREQLEHELIGQNVELAQANRKLEDALDEIRVLRGILPICSFCKKIRDSQGTWKPFEVFIQQHSSAEFSHGLCPECGEQHYPGLFNRP